MRNVVEHRDRRVEQAVAEGLFEIGQRQQSLAQLRAVLQFETAHATDLVGGLRALDGGGRDRGMPAVVSVEVAQHGPDRIGRSIEDRAFDDMRHRQPPNARFNASNPPWNTPPPMLLTSSVSRSGAQSNSAVHSRKVWSPSVTGVSRNVAT